MIDCCSINVETLDLPTRYTHDTTPEDFETLEFSPEEDAKLTAAAHRGPLAISLALAGDQTAVDELRRLHIVRWEHAR